MPSEKRDYAKYSAQDRPQIQSAVDKSCFEFAFQFMMTGRIGYCSRSGNTLMKYRFPSAQTLVKLYVLGYKLREAPLMNEVVEYIQDQGISFRKMTGTLWEMTAEIAKEMGNQCTLRNVVVDEMLRLVQERRILREYVGVNCPPEFQSEFFLKLSRLGLGRYIIGFDKEDGYHYEFPEKKNDGGKNKRIKLSPDSRLHNRVLGLLKGRSASSADKTLSTVSGRTPVSNDEEVPEESTPSLYASELRALDKYIEAFPYGYKLIPTSTDNLLCGLDSISKTIAAMHPTLPCPSISDLQAIVTSEEYQTVAREFALNGETVHTNLFSVDELAKILQIWGNQSAVIFQLGWLTDNGLPRLFPCLNEGAALVVFLHNDDAEKEFSGVVAGAFGTEFGGILGHWSALRPRTSLNPQTPDE